MPQATSPLLPSQGSASCRGTVDLVICFECFQMKVIDGASERVVAIGTEAEAEFDHALARHKPTKSRD